MKERLNTNWRGIVHLLLLLAMAFLVLFIAEPTRFYREFFNSDTLYLPSLYVDLYENGRFLSQWNLNPAPNFFPDMGIYFLLMKCCGGNFLIATALYSLLQIAVIYGLLCRVVKKFVPNYNWVKLWGGTLLMLFFLPALFSDDFLFTFYLLSNSYHLGSFLLALGCLLLVWNYLDKGGVWRLGMTLIISILGTISDRSFGVAFSIPIIFVALFFFVKLRERKYLWVATISLAGFVMGMFLLYLNKAFSWYRLAEVKPLFAWEDVPTSFLVFFRQTLDYLLEFSWVSLIFLIAIFSFVLLVVKTRNLLIKKEIRQDETEAFRWISLLFVLASILMAPILVGKYTGLDHIRYNYHVLIVLVFIFPMLFAKQFKRGANFLQTKKSQNIGFIVAVVLLICSSWWSIERNGMHNYFEFYPERVAELDSCKEKHNLKYGLATYWDAKYNTMFSKKGLRVYCVYDNLIPYDVVSNGKWYTDSMENPDITPVYNFFILEDEVMLENIAQVFSSFEVIEMPNCTLVKTPDFHLDKDTQKIVLE